LLFLKVFLKLAVSESPFQKIHIKL
jgi:hypothetical protein